MDHLVALPHLFVDPFEITAHTYACVRAWGKENGYDLRPGTNKGMEAVGNVNWYDCVKCCNALSELAGKTPVYYTDATHKEVYRFGELDLSDDCILPQADGYALPTAGQWEFACRAGTTTRYYWGDQPDLGPDFQYAHQWYAPLRNQPGVFPVGTLKPNGFGLYDMSGNVAEWCWDWHTDGVYRNIRGGSVALDSILDSGFASFCRPQFYLYETGFRVISKSPLPVPQALTKEMTPSYELPQKPVWDKELIAKQLRSMASYPDCSDTDTYLAQVVRVSMDHFAKADFEEDFLVFLQGNPDDFLSLPDQLRWIAFDDQGMQIRSETCSLESLKTLITAWIERQDSQYLQKWFALLKSYQVTARWAYDCLTPEQRGYNVTFPLNWFFGQGYDVPRRGRAILSAMAKIAAHASPEEIPTDIWCGLLVLMGGVQTDVGIRDGRDPVPNQALSGAKSLLMLHTVMPEFHHAPIWLSLGIERFCAAAGGRTMLADGSDMEQSFNYNHALPREAVEISTWLTKIAPETAQELLTRGLHRKRFLRSLTTPFGGVPSSGTAAQLFPPEQIDESYRTQLSDKAEQDCVHYPDPMFDRIRNHLFGDGSLPLPEFTSIAFPYGGYYVFRDGWNNHSLYAFLMGSRAGFGHCCNNINGLDVSAYGRVLLCSAGASFYGSMDFVPKHQQTIITQIEAYRFSTFGHNTLSVDGASQRRLIYGENVPRPPYEQPINARFFPSDTLEFAESFYQDGYGNHQQEILVDHHRMVFFFKQEKLWIVVDDTNSELPHEYTLSWGFPPRSFCFSPDSEAIGDQMLSNGFAPEEIQIDSDQQKIFTQDGKGANVFLYPLGEVTLSRHFGELSPPLGWIAPAIRGERYQKTDIHVSYQGKNTRRVTVIAPSMDCSDPISCIQPTEEGYLIKLKNGSCITMKTKDELKLSCQDYGMVISPQQSYFFKQDEKTPITAPKTFRWEDGMRPCYE